MAEWKPDGTRGLSRDAAAFWTRNGEAVPLDAVPGLSSDAFADWCLDHCSTGSRLAACLALPSRDSGAGGASEVLAVIADDAGSRLGLVRMELPVSRSYAALSSRLPQAQAFERELLELNGIHPLGHPWLKPLRRHADLESGIRSGGQPDSHPFFRVEGEGIHEIGVGPVHAGIIEPGHFRLQCYGEQVLHLEIQLGYQHRGAEALLLSSSPARRLVVAESLAGDSVLGHSLAHCGAIEALADAEVSLNAQTVRGIALELERIANHVGDLGALCGDVGYLPGASWLGRLRGEFLNLLLELSGNRYGRGLVSPGGVRFGLSAAQRRDWLERLPGIERDLRDTADLMFGNSSVGDRFEHTGALARETGEALGLVGPVARASGCDRDLRRDHPHGVFRFAHIPVALAE